MERRTLVITFTGDEPTEQQAVRAVVAMANSGCAIDATANIEVTCLNSEERAQAAAIFSERTTARKGKGITVKVESSDRAEKIIDALKTIINGTIVNG